MRRLIILVSLFVLGTLGVSAQGREDIVLRIASAYEACRQKGAVFFSEPFRIEGGALDGCRFVYMRDPDGITVELFEVPEQREGASDHR